MKPVISETLTTADDDRPSFDCDLSAKDGRDEMCMREFLRTYVPVMV